MSIILNPSLAAQNGLAMVAALSCVEFLREIPIYAAGEEPSKKSITVKFLLAIIVVLVVMFIMFTYSHGPPAPPALPVLPGQPGSVTVQA